MAAVLGSGSTPGGVEKEENEVSCRPSSAHPHHPAYSHCAYTEKVRKFCDMMGVNHEVFLYSGTDDEAPGQRIQCAPERPRQGTASTVLPTPTRSNGRGPALLAGDKPSCCFGNQPPKEGR